MQQQQQTNWCWSAVSVSVKLFFAPANPVTQCDQANRQLAKQTCCGEGAATTCNVSWFLDRALGGLGNLATHNAGVIPFSTVQAQVAAGRPVGCRIGWFGGGGHFVTIDGCDPASSNQLLTIKDPFYGTSVVPYATFVSSYRGAGSWTTFYLTKP